MKTLALITLNLLGAASPASAAIIDATYEFSGTFDDGPLKFVDGSITLKYDNTKTGPATVVAFKSSAFQDYLTGAEFQRNDDEGITAILFGYCMAAESEYGCGLRGTHRDYLVGFEIDEVGNVTSLPASIEHTIGDGTSLFYTNGQVARLSAISSVAEPSAWIMMILGFAAVGYAMRRKTVLRYV